MTVLLDRFDNRGGTDKNEPARPRVTTEAELRCLNEKNRRAFLNQRLSTHRGRSAPIFLSVI